MLDPGRTLLGSILTTVSGNTSGNNMVSLVVMMRLVLLLFSNQF